MGTVERGKLADLVLLDANPLDDIDEPAKDPRRRARGTLLDRAALDRMLHGVESRRGGGARPAGETR